jgi:hypothetical protein
MAQAFRLKYLFKLPEGTSSAEPANARGSVNWSWHFLLLQRLGKTLLTTDQPLFMT